MATISHSTFELTLSDSKRLRQLTVLLFYFTQGFPIGIFYYALPAWMAANGAGIGQIAAVVAASTLPWSLKLVNGFLIDRYTFLPMGRRRVWIIGAQAALVGAFLVAAAVNPPSTEIALLSALGFAANTAVTFQDVGIDSLVVDIMPEDERLRASGFMFGAQVIGISAATALGGAMFAQFGFAGGMLAAAAIPAVVLFYGIAIRERAGERRMPWSIGETHAISRSIQVEAWWPLLRNAFAALFAPMSLLLLPILIARAIPAGAFEAFHPVLFTQIVGWKLEEWTGFYSSILLGAGIFGLVLGGTIVEKMGARAALLFATSFGATLLMAMGFAQALWSTPFFALTFVILYEVCALFFFIAAIPLAMRMCTPAVAATQFTIYMAVANFGRPLGAIIAGATAGEGSPQWLYWIAGAAFGMAALILALTRFPSRTSTEQAVAAQLPQGEGIAPRID